MVDIVSGTKNSVNLKFLQLTLSWYWRIAKWLIGGKVAYQKSRQANTANDL
jgi:hypothetical protein